MTENKTAIPIYELSESKLELTEQKVSLFKLDLQELIYEKMFLLFEKLQVNENKLAEAEIDLQICKDKLLLETDFSEVLGKSRTNQGERDAYMKPFLAEHENKIDEYNTVVKFYKTKLNIINDLITAKRTLLTIEGALHEWSNKGAIRLHQHTPLLHHSEENWRKN